MAFRLKRSESVPESVRRIAREEQDSACVSAPGFQQVLLVGRTPRSARDAHVPLLRITADSTSPTGVGRGSGDPAHTSALPAGSGFRRLSAAIGTYRLQPIIISAAQ
jgi:hypothetical protein